MIDFVTCSFPFLDVGSELGMDTEKAKHYLKSNILNSLCRNHSKENTFCPFLNLAGHTFSCAFLLSTLPELIDTLKEIVALLSEICEGLNLKIKGEKTDSSLNLVPAIKSAPSLFNNFEYLLKQKGYIFLINDDLVSREKINLRNFNAIKKRMESIDKKIKLDDDTDRSIYINDLKYVVNVLLKMTKLFDNITFIYKNLPENIVKSRETNLSAVAIRREHINVDLQSQVLQMAKDSGIWSKRILEDE